MENFINTLKSNKIVYGLINIFLNHLGIVAFLNGYTKTGIIYLIMGLLPVICYVNIVFGIIAAIDIFKMTDEEFAAADKASLLKGWPAPSKD